MSLKWVVLPTSFRYTSAAVEKALRKQNTHNAPPRRAATGRSSQRGVEALYMPGTITGVHRYCPAPLLAGIITGEYPYR